MSIDKNYFNKFIKTTEKAAIGAFPFAYWTNLLHTPPALLSNLLVFNPAALASAIAFFLEGRFK